MVINRGSVDGVKAGSSFLVYALSPDALVDPETGESLGELEIVRGRGVATHVQERVATIEPEEIKSRRRVIRSNPSLFGMMGREEVIEEPQPQRGEFEDPQVGDKVKPI